MLCIHRDMTAGIVAGESSDADVIPLDLLDQIRREAFDVLLQVVGTFLFLFMIFRSGISVDRR
jgi:hypothetical protein